MSGVVVPFRAPLPRCGDRHPSGAACGLPPRHDGPWHAGAGLAWAVDAVSSREVLGLEGVTVRRTVLSYSVTPPAPASSRDVSSCGVS